MTKFRFLHFRPCGNLLNYLADSSHKTKFIEIPFGSLLACYNAMNLFAVVRHPVSGHSTNFRLLRTDSDFFRYWSEINGSIFNKFQVKFITTRIKKRKYRGDGEPRTDRLSISDHPYPQQNTKLFLSWWVPEKRSDKRKAKRERLKIFPSSRLRLRK